MCTTCKPKVLFLLFNFYTTYVERETTNTYIEGAYIYIYTFYKYSEREREMCCDDVVH